MLRRFSFEQIANGTVFYQPGTVLLAILRLGTYFVVMSALTIEWFA